MTLPIAESPASDIPKSLQLERGSAQQRQRYGIAPGINIEPGVNDDGWETPPPITIGCGTVIRLYKDGEALHAAYEAISAAKFRVCLEVYIFRSDDTGVAFAELLARKARQGLGVYVIHDSYGSMASDRAMLDMMARAGVRLAEFHPVWPWKCQFSWRPVNRDHRKLLLIDDHIAGLGGLNIGGEYAGSWVVRTKSLDVPWRDNAISLEGPAARLLMASFARTWRYVRHGGRMRSAELIHHLFEGDFGVLASAPTRSSPLEPLLKKLMHEAKSSIVLTMAYFAPPDELVEELCRAVARGVRVRLMLPGLSDLRWLLVAARAFYDKLLAAGVEIYERQGAILHAKTMCIDGYTTIIGSTNLDYRSIEANYELSVLIRHRDLAGQIHELFENDVRFARPISRSDWRRRPRPAWDRAVQWAVDRMRYLW